MQPSAAGIRQSYAEWVSRSAWPGRLQRQGGWLLLLATILTLTALPVWAALRESFEASGIAYRDMLASPSFSSSLKNTIALALGSLAMAMTLGTWLAWNAIHLPQRARWASLLPLLPLILPPVAAAAGWTFLLTTRQGYINIFLRKLPIFAHLDRGPIDVFTVPWIVILTGISLIGFVYLFVLTAMRRLDGSTIEAARMSGSSSVEVFFKIVLPSIRPALVYATSVALLLGLGQFTYPLMLGRQSGINVITTEMFLRTQMTPINRPLASAFAAPLVIFGVVVVIWQRWLLRDPTRYIAMAGKSQQMVIDVRRRAVAWMLAYGTLAVALPVIALATVALSPFWMGIPQVDDLTLRHIRAVLLNDRQWLSAVWNSAVTSFIAAQIVLPIGYFIARYVRAPLVHKWKKSLLEFLVNLSLAMPATVFAFGLLVAYSGGVFGHRIIGTTWILIIAYITLMVPHAVRYQQSGLQSIGFQFEEASRTAGASQFQTFWRIIFPLLRPSIAAAAAIIFVLLSHEFSASIMVRQVRLQVMGTYLYEFYDGGSYPQVAVMALAMTTITFVGVGIAMLVGGRDALDRM